MGCLFSSESNKIGSSQVVPVIPASEDCCQININNGSKIIVSHPQKQIKCNSAKSSKSLNSCDSLGDGEFQADECDRGFSATSKVSKHSSDSGLGGEDHSDFITEDSDPHVVDEIQKNFQEPLTLDLSVVGVKCPTRLSAKQKQRQEEQQVIETLRNEGLITKLTGQSSKGLAFEIIQERPESVIPPARLEDMKRKKMQKEELTEQEIRQKLFEAERRRKQLEEERIVKVKSMEKTETAGAIQAFVQRQKLLEDQQTKKMEEAVVARQTRLREMRDKLKQKERHAQAVRERKQLNLDTITPSQDGEHEHISSN
ncbi:hypothetical protein LOTGIDRAFT_237958 [Lottia gigantea]|uniref:Stathmin-4 n=1 Tax=Lottia gigantea TaxID=225164 RepID=V4AY10_LOTGI|nr:hypothetical protein LOTGIDRAFT_237958 [Lottia gigantea]ESP02453.1 hypothetical protein LOTGIDRAFT_237958 [Lottia gigantea]